MTTSSATRSIDINAAIEEVFAFMSNPVESLKADPEFRGVISDIETDPRGVVTGYKWTERIGQLPFDVHSETTVEECVLNEHLVERNSAGYVSRVSVAPSDGGTRLTLAFEFSSHIPLLDRLKVLVATQGKGLDRYIDAYLREIKKLIET